MYFLICLSSLYSQAGLVGLQKNKKQQYTWSSISKALWDINKKKFVSNTIDLHFQCGSKKGSGRAGVGGNDSGIGRGPSLGHRNKIHVSVLRSPKNSTSFPVIMRIQTGWTPPSGKGYMQFIYIAEWNADKSRLLVHQKNQNITKDLIRLSTQVFKNQEIGKKEYQEKIKYCETLKNPQKCFASASRYQVGEALILLELDFGKKFEKLLFAFDPTTLKNVKQLHCYSE